MSTTFERIAEVTARVLKVNKSIITPQSRFVQDLGADSMQSVELAAMLEEEFEIEMDEEKALAVKNVGDAVKYIDQLLAEKGPAA